MTHRLIIHADDFGLCREVDEGIERAAAEGALSSASLMAVGETFDAAVRRARSLPTLDIGVHLTLVGEAPLLGGGREGWRG